ncbi:MAG: ribosome-binding factor A [Rhodospirillaceae bacterium]|nr:ribosome-binding factor A [Rhodospirillaceae bacterium]OUU27460.1 MAG: ribosome-binding factor A [Candidatus Endolissoclinum sp. TMED37]
MSAARSKQEDARDGIPSQRQYKVGEIIKKALVETLERVEIRDPALSGASITISQVEIGPDLKLARVFIMPLGGHNQEKVLEGLERATTFLRKNVAERVALKYTPRLIFKVDNAFDSSQHIDRLFKSPNYRINQQSISGKLRDK